MVVTKACNIFWSIKIIMSKKGMIPCEKNGFTELYTRSLLLPKHRTLYVYLRTAIFIETLLLKKFCTINCCSVYKFKKSVVLNILED